MPQRLDQQRHHLQLEDDQPHKHRPAVLAVDQGDQDGEDGDDRDDVAVFRSGAWYVLRSSNGALMAMSFGIGGDLPIPAAYKPQ